MESAAPKDDGCAGASAAPAPGVGPHDAPTTGMDSLAAAAQLVSFCQTAAPNDVHSAPVPAAVPVAVPQPRLPMVPILDPIKLEAEQHTPPHTELISYPGLAAPADRSWTGEAEGWRAPPVPLLRCPAPALPGPGWGPPVPAREVFFADITTLQVAAGRPFLKYAPLIPDHVQASQNAPARRHAPAAPSAPPAPSSPPEHCRRPPTVGSKILDLYTLYTSVVRLGGMHRVAKKKLWKAVAAELRLPLTCTDYGFRLRRHYERYLCAPVTVHPPTTPAAMFCVAVLLSAVCVCSAWWWNFLRATCAL